MTSWCNLDLLLFAPSSSESTNFHSQESVDQKATLGCQHIIPPAVYDVCDPSELQAIAILLLARKEMEKKLSYSRPNLIVPFMVRGPLGVLSLKRSLRRFLQKRRERVQSAVPYI